MFKLEMDISENKCKICNLEGGCDDCPMDGIMH